MLSLWFTFLMFPSLFLFDEIKDSSKTIILDFSKHSDQTYALFLRQFPSMSSMTICTQLRFDPNSSGIFTIFSYSVYDFQLQAKLVQGKRVQLALRFHGKQGSYAEAFKHDSLWHSVCVSWSLDVGAWALYAHGHMISSGDGINRDVDSIGPNGDFIIGQGKHGSSSESNDSFSGSITELHVWNRVLSSCEIFTMENECSIISSGLVLKWEKVHPEIVSPNKQWNNSPCQGSV